MYMQKLFLGGLAQIDHEISWIDSYGGMSKNPLFRINIYTQHVHCGMKAQEYL